MDDDFPTSRRDLARCIRARGVRYLAAAWHSLARRCPVAPRRGTLWVLRAGDPLGRRTAYGSSTRQRSVKDSTMSSMPEVVDELLQKALVCELAVIGAKGSRSCTR